MLHITCNMCTRDLPDMYARSPRAAGPRAEGIHIRQIPRARVTTITYIIVLQTYTASRAEPNMLKILPIIPSRTSQKFDRLFFLCPHHHLLFL